MSESFPFHDSPTDQTRPLTEWERLHLKNAVNVLNLRDAVGKSYEESQEPDLGTEEDVQWQLCSGSLCAPCRSVRWLRLEPIDKSQTTVLHRLEASSIPLAESSCVLCRFFSALAISPYTYAHGEKPKRLDATPKFSIGPVSFLRNSLVFALYIGHYYHGTIGLIRSKKDRDVLGPRILDPGLIDYNILRKWLRICQGSHPTMCQPQYTGHVPLFRVIDCESEEVIPPPPNCKYVALSYVWGRPTSIVEIGIDARFPPTIEDSIIVTKELGYRYLWVDRYCIEQENHVEQHRQLQTMDVVYSQAQLTIIAAAGSDPTHGLPGVRSRQRIPQQQLTIGGVTFVQIKYPPKDFNLYPWASRAWTYQEGLLSRRKLIFTDHGVFYACNQTHGAESINKHHSRTILEPGPFAEMTRLHYDLTYETMIKEYTGRTLSFDSDALNACLGILKAKNTIHTWGIRMTTDVAARRHTLSLCFVCDQASRRRPDFPSWSWAGWNGSVSLLNDVIIGQLCEIRLGDGGHDWHTIPEFALTRQAERDAGSSQAPRFLEMTGPALVWQFTEGEIENLRTYQTMLDKSIKETRRFRIPLRDDSPMEPRACLDMQLHNPRWQLVGCIAMAVWCNYHDDYMTALLLRPDQEKRVWSRVGVVLFGGDEYVGYGAGEEGRDVKISELWRKESETMTVVVG